MYPSVVSRIYALPLRSVVLVVLTGMLLWGFLQTKLNERVWRRGNLALLALSIAAMLYLTVFDRRVGSYEVLLKPFSLFEKARKQRELYRAMLMNVFLFFPLGLTLPNVLTQRWSRWGRIALTTFFACLLSAGIEYAQYRFSLGMAETDDVLCNTLGAFLGACSLLIAYGVEKLQKKTK